ncbi:MAG: hypothetical protein D6815_00905 [Candidatus Dadabacteria bacterium]|nr:MAG: hypothetical protein D6815_00905 [Candidatus Dadabacteria bacterium]
MQALADNGLISPGAPFNDEIEWTWFHLWHQDGRRARNGAAVMAPNYTQWYGSYEVARHFYQDLIPQARRLAQRAIADGHAEQGRRVLAVIDEVLSAPEHRWAGGKIDPAELAAWKEAHEKFSERYAQ